LEKRQDSDHISSLYYADVGRHTLPTKEEEVRLFKTYRALPDGKEKDELGKYLACFYLRFVIREACKRTRDPQLRKDLISEGNVGLMLGVMKFDPEVGVRFLTYTANWIKVNMQEHLKRTGVVRIPNHTLKTMQKKYREDEILFAKGEITDFISGKPIISPIDANAHSATDDTESSVTSMERNILKHMIEAKLPLRDRLILAYYFGLRDGAPKTFREIAQLFFELDGSCVTSDQIRQSKERSLGILKEHFEWNDIEDSSDLF
jgi:RNA polymerase sigma factor (sigma-70 family)